MRSGVLGTVIGAAQPVSIGRGQSPRKFVLSINGRIEVKPVRTDYVKRDR